MYPRLFVTESVIRRQRNIGEYKAQQKFLKEMFPYFIVPDESFVEQISQHVLFQRYCLTISILYCEVDVSFRIVHIGKSVLF